MRIAFFSKYLPSDEPNGVSVQADRLARALSSLGHTLTCFTFSPAPEGAEYEIVKLQWTRRSKLMRKFSPAVAFGKIPVSSFDIAHYHGDDYLCAGSPRRIRTFYGSAIDEAFHAGKVSRFMYQGLFYIFEWISCLKQGTFAGISATTLKCLPLVKSRIPCCVPLGSYFPSGPKTPHPSILFVGDLDSRKRGSLLISAFHRDILPRFPGSTLAVVGPEPCHGDGIVYKGRITEKELIDEYRKAWVYCLPSSYEGFGVPAIEAMACGTAVVATRNSGVAEILKDGKNGILCEPQELGASLLKVIGDRELSESLTAEGMISAKRYDSRKIAAEYEKLYENALDNRSQPILENRLTHNVFL